MSTYLTLSIIRYRLRVNWSNQGNRVVRPLHLGVAATEKGAFGSPSTKVTNFTLLYFIYIYIYDTISIHKIFPQEIHGKKFKKKTLQISILLEKNQ